MLILDNLPEDWDEAAQSRIWPMPEFGNRLNRLITRKEEKATAMRLVRGRQGGWDLGLAHVGAAMGVRGWTSSLTSGWLWRDEHRGPIWTGQP